MGCAVAGETTITIEGIMRSSDRIDVAIIGAVPPEIRDLSPLLRNGQVSPFLGETVQVGDYGNRRILLGTTGFGKVNAAIVTAALLEHFLVGEVWHIGCAGAYAEGKLGVGDVLIAQNLLCGDEGILMENEVLPTSRIGIPILIQEGQPYYDDIPSDACLIRWVRDKTPAGHYRLTGKSGDPGLEKLMDGERRREDRNGSGAVTFQVAFGSSLTVSMVSGDAATARERFRRFGALAENMEGSAVAQTCFRFGVPMLECRGISNVAGDRCKARWRMETAVSHCQGIVMEWLSLLDDSLSPYRNKPTCSDNKRRQR